MSAVMGPRERRAAGVPTVRAEREARATALAGAAVVVVAAALDVLTPPGVVLIGLTVIGPLVASLRATARQTGAIALLAVVTAVLLGVTGGLYLTLDHLIRVSVVAAAGVLSMSAARQRTERMGAMERLAHVAELAQEVMLRPPPRHLAGLGLAARYVSASTESRIGGDLYETAFTATGVRVIVGDARGKGLDGIRLAAAVLAAFREEVWETDLGALAAALDERVTKEAADDEDFVTAVIVEVGHDGGVSVANCGHHPPLRIRDGTPEPLEPAEPTTPLGLASEPRIERYAFEAGDRLLLCTDGLLEARAADGRFFALEDHLDVLALADPQEAVDALVIRLMEHLPGDLDDDMAVLLVDRQTPVAPSDAAG